MSVSVSVSVFWADDPNVLFASSQWFPSSALTFEEKLNALSRSLLVITIALLIYGKKKKTIIVMFLFTFLMIYAIHDSHKTEKFSNKGDQNSDLTVCGLPKQTVSAVASSGTESLTAAAPVTAEAATGTGTGTGTGTATGTGTGTGAATATGTATAKTAEIASSTSYSALDANKIRVQHPNEDAYLASTASFHRPSAANPFSNPILSQANTTLAPPITVPAVRLDVNKQAKAAATNANAKISHSLFMKKTDNLAFDQSMRAFYSVPRDEGHVLKRSQHLERKKGGSALFAA